MTPPIQSVGMVDRIQFELLHRSADTGAAVGIKTLENSRPPAGRIERCARWLRSQNISAHDTEFGLACSATPEDFERVFSVAVRITGVERGQNALVLDGDPCIPDAIAEDIGSLTLSRTPEFFS